MHLFIFLAGVFLLTFLLGKQLEKIRIPWIFSALLIGLGLAAYNPFIEATSSDAFDFLAHLGMYFLLFIIGFELELKKVFSSNKFIIKSTFIIILSEAIAGTLVIHYFFGTSWLISALVASSFATVGEAILLPILDEFKLTKTKLGQTILGIGVLDDVVEIITIIAASIIIGRVMGETHLNIWLNLFVLFSLFGLMFLIVKARKKIESMKFKNIPLLFLFVIFIIFLFIGIGNFAEAAALGALLAGISLKNVIPPKMLRLIDSEIRTVAYGLFAPIFFLWVGLDTNISHLIKYPLLILLLMVVSNGTKIISSYILGRNYLGPKKSIVLGIGLSVKFSTSIVIIKFLFDKGAIDPKLYSILIGTTIAFKFVVPTMLSYFIKRWKIDHDGIKV